MTEFVTFTVGRNAGCEIKLSDASVSRRHAELVVTKNSYFLTDCKSSYGTSINQNGSWIPIRQANIGLEDSIKLGEYVTSLRDLLTIAQRAGHLIEVKGAFVAIGTPNTDDRPVGKVRRNPQTGEIEGDS